MNRRNLFKSLIAAPILAAIKPQHWWSNPGPSLLPLPEAMVTDATDSTTSIASFSYTSPILTLRRK